MLGLVRPPRALTALIFALLLAAAIAAPRPANAAQSATTLGPAPVQADCLGFHDPTRGCYYDVGEVDYAVSSHIVHVGDTFTGTASWDGTYTFPWSFYGAPPGAETVKCTGMGPLPSGSCTYKAVAPSGGWSPAPGVNNGQPADGGWGAAIYCCTIGTYVDGDYIAILGGDQYAIDGFVTDVAGKPVTDATIFISGTDKDGGSVDLYTTTDDTGYYNALLKKGSYHVSGSYDGHSLCLKADKTQCIQSKFGVNPDATVDFRRNGYAEITGTVTDDKGKPMQNVEVFAADSSGKAVAAMATDPSGNYRIDLHKEGTYKVYPLYKDSTFVPDQKTVDAKVDEQATADFKEAENPLKVTIQGGHVTAVDKNFSVPLTITNQSKTLTVTDLKAVNPYYVQIAANAFPPDQTGKIQVLESVAPDLPSSLAPGQSYHHDIRMKAVAGGLVGIRATFSGSVKKSGGGTRQVKDSHDARILIQSSEFNNEEQTQLAAQYLESFMDQAGQHYRELQRRDALKLFRALRKRLSPKARKLWFGSKSKLKITDQERLLARFAGLSPEQVALALPNKRLTYKGRRLDDVDTMKLFQASNMKYSRREVMDWLKSRIGTPAAKLYQAGVRGLQYLSLAGSAEGRTQLANDLATKWQSFDQSWKINQNAMIDAVFASGPDDISAMRQSAAATSSFLKGTVHKMDDAIAGYEVHQNKFRNGLAADMEAGDYQAVQDKVAKRYNHIEGKVFQIEADAMLGEGATHVTGKVISGAGTGMLRMAEGLGLGNARRAERYASSIDFGAGASSGLPSYVDDLSSESKFAIGMDRLRQVGGISGKDMKITQQIVGKVNQDLADMGYSEKIALVARPVNPIEAVGGLAKVEVVGVKSVTPVDELLGASTKALGEPAVFDPIDPTTLPRWNSYDPVDQRVIQQRYALRKSEYLEWQAKSTPSSDWKMRAMKEATNGEATVTVPGRNPGDERTYKLALDTQQQGGTTVFRYKHLEVDGNVIYSGEKSARIGTDVDLLAAVNAKTKGTLPPEVEDIVHDLYQKYADEAAKTQGYSNPYHGWTLRRPDMSDLSVENAPKYKYYGLQHLSEQEARKEAQRVAEEYNAAFPDRKPLTADDVLKKVSQFEQPAITITESDVLFGNAGIVFTDP